MFIVLTAYFLYQTNRDLYFMSPTLPISFLFSYLGSTSRLNGNYGDEVHLTTC